MEPVLISELPIEVQFKTLAAFNELASNQRGKPERMGGGGPLGANPGKLHASGIWTLLTEHVGDLTHRMAQKNCENINYGAEIIIEKCNRAIRYLAARYPVSRDIEEQLKNNYDYQREEHGVEMSFEEWHKMWVDAGIRYAAAHAELTVYNPAQYKARQAAIAVGLRQYYMAAEHCNWLLEHAQSSDWQEVAGSVIINEEGTLLSFEQWPSSFR